MQKVHKLQDESLKTRLRQSDFSNVFYNFIVNNKYLQSKGAWYRIDTQPPIHPDHPAHPLPGDKRRGAARPQAHDPANLATFDQEGTDNAADASSDFRDTAQSKVGLRGRGLPRERV